MKMLVFRMYSNGIAKQVVIHGCTTLLKTVNLPKNMKRHIRLLQFKQDLE